MAPKQGRRPDPAIPDGVTGQALGQVVWDELKTLSKDNMKGVAAHIECAYLFLDEDLDAALAHAETASRRAGRVPSAREALGTVHYARGEWSDALRELRTAMRLGGTTHLLPLVADCQRGLGRPEKALELAESREAQHLSAESLVEMAIVLAGAHRDLGNPAAAVAMLETPAGRVKSSDPMAGRLWFALAEALQEQGDDRAAQWYAKAESVGETGEAPVPEPEEGVFYDLEDFAPADAGEAPVAAPTPSEGEAASAEAGRRTVDDKDAAEADTVEADAPEPHTEEPGTEPDAEEEAGRE
ncbi:tetratricopeptide repeat protein [Kytococcus schroeteri]|uniref:tetratricopeptide repeat protein n=1 Tax=Kytococcus schroeteri TaxID=138300 RepID=UPI00114195B9